MFSTQSQYDSWLEKVGNWGTWFPGNFAIWREIYEFETKKYIRNVGKYCNLGGKFYHVPGESNIFSSHDDYTISKGPNKICFRFLKSWISFNYVILIQNKVSDSKSWIWIRICLGLNIYRIISVTYFNQAEIYANTNIFQMMKNVLL